MSLLLLLVILLVVFGGGGFYGYRRGWYPAGGFGGILGLVVLILILAWLFGGVHLQRL